MNKAYSPLFHKLISVTGDSKMEGARGIYGYMTAGHDRWANFFISVSNESAKPFYFVKKYVGSSAYIH